MEQKTELMPLIHKGDDILVDARLLHKMLRVGKDFRHWINDRILDYGFEENKDFFRVTEPGRKQPRSSAPIDRKINGVKINYNVTLEMAKELAMIERNDTGRVFRRYFIAKEKEARILAIGGAPDPKDIFRQIKQETINGYSLFRFVDVMKQLGYSPYCGSNTRKSSYPNHFVKIGNALFITEAYAGHLFKSAMIIRSRKAVRAMQPVLQLDFGRPIELK